MVNAWGGYSNGQIPLSAMAELQGQYFEPSMFQAMVSLINQCAAQGVDIHINEGYRPLGDPSDRYVINESQTSTGGSNQWFQLGRMDRGETPSAGTPGTSSHGWGMAADIRPGRDNNVVRSVAESLGLSFNISSESWHCVLGGGGSSSSFVASSDQQRTIQQILKDQGLYSGIVDGEFGPLSWKAVQSWLANYGLYNGPIDGDPGPKTYAGFQQYGKKNGNYDGALDGILGPLSWAGFVQSLKEDTAVTPAPAPTPVPTPAPVVEKPVEKPIVKPVDKPTKPNKPNKETKPMPTIKPLPTEATDAGSDALGILIANPKGRKLAYALYGLSALIVSNIGVGIMAAGVQAPVWVIVASAIVGNLAVPFTTLAIANAPAKKK